MTLYKPLAQAVSYLKRIAPHYGFHVVVTSGLRSHQKQAKLYASRRLSKYPTAAPGRSQHEYGFAVDLVAKPSNFQQTLVQLAQSIGLVWSPSDPIHFAVFSNSDWTQILAQAGHSFVGGGPGKVALPAALAPDYTPAIADVVSATGQGAAAKVPLVTGVLSAPIQPGLAVPVTTATPGGLPPGQNIAVQSLSPSSVPGVSVSTPVSVLTGSPLGPGVLVATDPAQAQNPAMQNFLQILPWYQGRWQAQGLTPEQQASALSTLKASLGLAP